MAATSENMDTTRPASNNESERSVRNTGRAAGALPTRKATAMPAPSTVRTRTQGVDRSAPDCGAFMLDVHSNNFKRHHFPACNPATNRRNPRPIETRAIWHRNNHGDYRK